MLNQLITLLLLCSVIACTPLNYPNRNSISDMPTKPGACFAKCQMPEEKVIRIDSILHYTGDDPKQKGVDIEKIKVKESESKWVKRKADRNCTSSNPDDCLVWCLVEDPESIEMYYVVTDTILVREYEKKYIEIEVKSKKNRNRKETEWQEVVCNSDITKELIRNIEVVLIQENYLINYIEGQHDKITPEVKEAYVNYQEHHNLPIGQLNLTTLEHMGIY